MNNFLLERMKQDLELKKYQLEERTKTNEIVWSNEKDSFTFERNMTSDLFNQFQLKTEIKLLEHYIMLVEMSKEE